VGVVIAEAVTAEKTSPLSPAGETIVLSLNSGSSSLKFGVYRVTPTRSSGRWYRTGCR
jgi:hypothetical protein